MNRGGLLRLTWARVGILGVVLGAVGGGCGNGLEELRQEAVGGDAKAQYDLGARYTKGKGVDEDAVEAVKWYRKAAAQDFALAKHSLGEAYEYGAGVPQDQIEAVAWYRQAANEGAPEAQLRLGAAYKEGRGVPRDYIQAHMWTNLAAATAKGELRETAVRLRELISWVMTPAQITEAERLASKWRPHEQAGR